MSKTVKTQQEKDEAALGFVLRDFMLTPHGGLLKKKLFEVALSRTYIPGVIDGLDKAAFEEGKRFMALYLLKIARIRLEDFKPEDIGDK